MKLSIFDVAKVIHEVERAALAVASVIDGESEDNFGGKSTTPPTPPAEVSGTPFEEMSPEYRDARAIEVYNYLQTGIAVTTGIVHIFEAVVKALR